MRFAEEVVAIEPREVVPEDQDADEEEERGWLIEELSSKMASPFISMKSAQWRSEAS